MQDRRRRRLRWRYHRGRQYRLRPPERRPHYRLRRAGCRARKSGPGDHFRRSPANDQAAPTGSSSSAGRVICVQFTSAWRSFGVDVNRRALPAIVPHVDPALSKQLERVVHEQVTVCGRRREPPVWSRPGQASGAAAGSEPIEADLVLVAVEREAKSESLGCENAGSRTIRGRMSTDEHLRTRAAGVYAVGDLLSGFSRPTEGSPTACSSRRRSPSRDSEARAGAGSALGPVRHSTVPHPLPAGDAAVCAGRTYPATACTPSTGRLSGESTATVPTRLEGRVMASYPEKPPSGVTPLIPAGS